MNELPNLPKADVSRGDQSPESTLRIIKNSLMKDTHDPVKVQTYLGGLGVMLKEKGNKLCRFGNSVFLVRVIGRGDVEVHTFSEETATGLVANYKSLVQYLKGLGVKKATTFSENPAFLRIAKSTGLPVKIDRTQIKENGVMRQTYKYSLEL